MRSRQGVIRKRQQKPVDIAEDAEKVLAAIETAKQRGVSVVVPKGQSFEKGVRECLPELNGMSTDRIGVAINVLVNSDKLAKGHLKVRELSSRVGDTEEKPATILLPIS